MATSSRSSKATSEVEIRQRNVGNDPRSASAAAQNPDAEDDIEIDDHVNEGNHDDMAGNGKTSGSSARSLSSSKRKRQAATKWSAKLKQHGGGPNKSLTTEATDYLTSWAHDHMEHPYPNEEDRALMIQQTGLTKERILHWFKNFRSRHWDPTLKAHYGVSKGASPTKKGKTQRKAGTTSRASAASAAAATTTSAAAMASTHTAVKGVDDEVAAAVAALSIIKSGKSPKTGESTNGGGSANSPKRKKKKDELESAGKQMKKATKAKASAAAAGLKSNGLSDVDDDDHDGKETKSPNTTATKEFGMLGAVLLGIGSGKSRPKIKSASTAKAEAAQSSTLKALPQSTIPNKTQGKLTSLKAPPPTTPDRTQRKGKATAGPFRRTSPGSVEVESTGRWTEEEHNVFLGGLDLHGNDWKSIADMIPSRNPTQIRTHAQKHYLKLEKDGVGVSPKPNARLPKRAPKPSQVATTQRAPDRRKAPTTNRMTAVGTAVSQLPDSDDNKDDDSDDDDDACCVCHCAVDCSDRALFFPKDRKRELKETNDDYFYSMDDPYLPDSCYDRNNALVFCDSCNRMFHQKCHFVPLLVLPRGEWSCLICTMQKKNGESATKRKRSSKTPEIDNVLESKEEWKKFLNPRVTKMLFQSHPPEKDSDESAVNELEKEWELATGPLKAQLWNQQLKQMRQYLRSQASNMRMADSALVTLTTTRRNRQHFASKNAKSQELAQTIVALTRAKLNIRYALLSLETLRTRDEPVDFSGLLEWCNENPEFVSNIFPFGPGLWEKKRRIVPRTQERKLTKEEEFVKSRMPTNGCIPNEIVINEQEPTAAKPAAKSRVASPKRQHSGKCKAVADRHKNGAKKSGKTATAAATHDEDDSSGISLGDLKCCVCMIGDSTDENDVILCDGQGCHRAFHMKCIHPAVTPQDLEDEDEDWFCPLCSGISNLIYEMHALCIGEEGHADDYEDGDEHASLESWDHAKDIYPTAEWEFETANKLLKGKRDEDTQRLLASFLGEDMHETTKNQMPVGSDSEDENDYSLFDDDSFQERRRHEHEGGGSDEDSSHSSQATLVEMSSVELNVGKAELAALSEEDEDDNEEGSSEDDDENEGQQKTRRSRRLQKKSRAKERVENQGMGVDFSEDNIIEGKRKRKHVDYRKLNDALFGNLSPTQQGQLDDGDDFQATHSSKRVQKKKPQRRTGKKQKVQEEEEEEGDSHVDSDADADGESSGEEDDSGNEKEQAEGEEEEDEDSDDN